MKETKIKEYDLIIGTTAVSRPNLHSEIFLDYCKFLKGLSCKWFININQIDDTKSVQETVSNLQNIFSSFDNIDVVYYEHDTGGTRKHFYDAVDFIMKQCLNEDSKYGIFWLEDDWKIRGDHGCGSCKKILEDVKQPYDYIQIVQRPRRNKNKEVSFNPSIFSKDALQFCHESLTNQENEWYNRNPERASLWWPRGNSFRTNYTQFQMFPVFVDAGRQWCRTALGYHHTSRTFNKK